MKTLKCVATDVVLAPEVQALLEPGRVLTLTTLQAECLDQPVAAEEALVLWNGNRGTVNLKEMDALYLNNIYGYCQRHGYHRAAGVIMYELYRRTHGHYVVGYAETLAQYNLHPDCSALKVYL